MEKRNLVSDLKHNIDDIFILEVRWMIGRNVFVKVTQVVSSMTDRKKIPSMDLTWKEIPNMDLTDRKCCRQSNLKRFDSPRGVRL
ncbi:unnamed protein product [Sphenostylis stenocarpa]|uniref:Uncharacterized protein n=1 Tax=Sphenostylis stenocarpa TaxID=92480 RepID=A0AA86VPL2_9FABA|nr:unnamed protein product [Sphenostylis stenocarpa]